MFHVQITKRLVVVARNAVSTQPQIFRIAVIYLQYKSGGEIL
jgi:hypothetical protein